MPAISSNSRVLVTGASGFIGIHVCGALIRRGHTVIGTVRSESKGDYVSQLLGKSFSYVVVKDISAPNTFDEIIKNGNLDAVVHTATPTTLKSTKPDEVIGPAVAGTLSILTAIHDFGHSIRRLVLTSSVASIYEPKDSSTPYVYTEKDWNNWSPKLVEKKTNKFDGWDIYRASKTIAERKAWEFMQDKKPTFDLVTIHPPYVFGPVVQQGAASLDSMNESTVLLIEALKGSPNRESIVNYVDVRDCADGHYLALQAEQAGGERIIVSAGKANYHEWKCALIGRNVAGVGRLGLESKPDTTHSYDNSKSKELLGLKYRDGKLTLFDGLQTYRALLPNVFKAGSPTHTNGLN